MKTLDHVNYFKSQDASQILFVHDVKIEQFSKQTSDRIRTLIDEFDCLKDEYFFNNLYDRKNLIGK